MRSIMALVAVLVVSTLEANAETRYRSQQRRSTRPSSQRREHTTRKPVSYVEESPRTLFEWSIGCNNCGEDEEPAERFGKFKDETIVTDRPDFTEASTTVGRGVLQIESGYTFFSDDSAGTETRTHSFPETLFRVGILADWLELRIGTNYFASETQTGAVTAEASGFDDLYIGAKLALTEQKGILPEMAITPQAFTPLGSDVGTGQYRPGVNWLYSWDLNESMTLGGSSQANNDVDGVGHSHIVFAQSATVGVSWTERLGSYTEWFALFPASEKDPGTNTEHYINGGLTFLLTRNIQFDVRGGLGLNDAATDYFTGAGVSTRF